MNKKMQSLILALLCFLLTIGICIQVKTVNSNGSTVSTSQSESELRDQVLKMKEKYEDSYEKLQKTEQQLEEARAKVTSNNEELQELERQIKEINTLLGLTDIKGQGVVITVTDGVVSSTTLQAEDLLVHNTDLLSIVNELKNAGAEAIEINGQRIVPTTSIICDGNVILINGNKVSSTFTINAIGMPELLFTLNRSGGYLSILEEYNIKTTLKKVEKIDISRYSGIMNFKYATPVE